MKRLAVALALVASTASAQPVRQFDLVCEVEVAFWKGSLTNVTRTANMTLRHSLDLDRNVWWPTPDYIVVPIIRVSDDMFVLFDGGGQKRTIDRRTGVYYDHQAFGGSGWVAHGTCERAPFTPPPPQKF